MKNLIGIQKQNTIGFIVLILLVFFNTTLSFAFPNTKLVSVRYNESSEAELVELILNKDPKYVTFYQPNPARYIVELKKSYYPKLRSKIKVNSKYIKNIRVRQYRYDKVRIVIELNLITPISGHVKDGKTLVFKLKKAPKPVEKPKPKPKPKPRKPKVIKKKTIKPIISLDTDKPGTVSKGKSKSYKDRLIDGRKPGVGDPEDSTDLSEADLDSLFDIAVKGSDQSTEEFIVDSNVSGEASKFSLNGSIKNETAYRLRKAHQFSKINNILNLKASGDITDSLSYVLSSRVSYDGVFDLTDNYDSRVEDDQRIRKDLRDAYIDIGLGNFDLRLGQQQIVWGQAVGLFFADIVNPKDLREFILPELDQVRIPVLAANAEYFYKDTYFQLVFIPFPEFNEFGSTGSEFDYSNNIYNQGAQIVTVDPTEPSNDLDNSEIGFRISKLTGGWDLSLFYLYDYYNFPVNYRYITYGPYTITYRPEYERINRVGSTFSKEISDFIFKGEFIYSDKMFYASSDTSDVDGIETSGQFEWLLGMDYTFSKKIETNVQIMQNIILDHENTMTKKEVTTSASLWVKTGFLDNRIEPEFFFVSSLDQKDYMFRPKVSYNHDDNIKFVIGADIFYGESDGDYGLFDQSDRVYFEMSYDF